MADAGTSIKLVALGFQPGFQPALHRTGRTLSMALETELAHRRWLAQHGLTLQWIGSFRLRLVRLSVFAFQICLRLSNANCASHRAAQRLIWGRVSAASVAIAVAGWWMAGFTALGVTPQMGRAAFR